MRVSLTAFCLLSLVAAARDGGVQAALDCHADILQEAVGYLKDSVHGGVLGYKSVPHTAKVPQQNVLARESTIVDASLTMEGAVAAALRLHSQKNRQTIWQTVWRDRDSLANSLLNPNSLPNNLLFGKLFDKLFYVKGKQKVLGKLFGKHKLFGKLFGNHLQKLFAPCKHPPPANCLANRLANCLLRKLFATTRTLPPNRLANCLLQKVFAITRHTP